MANKGIKEIKTLLEGVTGFSRKVVYYEWPIGRAPALPYVCYFSPAEDTFGADNINYYSAPQLRVELYTRTRDLKTEALFEQAFRDAGLYYTKESEFITDERVQMTLFIL